MISPLAAGYIGLGILVILLFTGIYIGVVMALLGFVGMVYLVGWDAALGVLKTVPYTTFANYDLSVIPLFLLMGEFCYHGGISGDLYKTTHEFLGRLRGGLAIATIGACAGFAAVCGSSVATAATMGTVALPEMKKYKYDSSLATGAVAAGGTIGILIPPSITFVIYGIITQQSIGSLFLAGFIPGITQALMFMGVILLLCQRNPNLGPSGPSSTWKEKIISLKNTWIVLALFLLVIGGIYAGIFTPTEAAGIGAIGALFFAIGRRRIHWQQFKSSIIETARTTGMLFFIILGAMLLGYFLAVSRAPFELAKTVASIPVSPYIIWVFVVILYLIMGCIMDSLAMILLTVPIFYPLMTQLGFDPIWFGVMLVILVEMGMITPPIGMNVFVIKGIAPDVPTYTIFRGIIPFVIADVVLIVVCTAFPAIALWLPQTLK